MKCGFKHAHLLRLNQPQQPLSQLWNGCNPCGQGIHQQSKKVGRQMRMVVVIDHQNSGVILQFEGEVIAFE